MVRVLITIIRWQFRIWILLYCNHFSVGFTHQSITDSTVFMKKYNWKNRITSSLPKTRQSILSFPKSTIPTLFRHLPSKEKNTSDDESNDDNEPPLELWTAGNVYEDLRILESRIIIENADNDLKKFEQKQILKEMARQRRPIFPDVRSFFLAPLGAAWALTMLNRHKVFKKLIGFFTRCSHFYFWLVGVVLPIVMLILKDKSGPPNLITPSNSWAFKDIVPQNLYIPWETISNSCRDYVLFLLEYWVATILPVAVFGVVSVVLMNISSQLYNQHAVWRSLAILFTRIGIVLSFYQYPEQLYYLVRPNRPRPMALTTVVFKFVVQNFLRWAPIFFAIDFFNLFTHLKRRSIINLYAAVAIIVGGASARMYKLKSSDPTSSHRFEIQRKINWIYRILIVWYYCTQIKRQMVVSWLKGYFRIMTWTISEFRPLLPVKKFGYQFLGLTAVISGLAHIHHFRSNVNIDYTDDIPISPEIDIIGKDENSPSYFKRLKWRYELGWRGPVRFVVMIKYAVYSFCRSWIENSAETRFHETIIRDWKLDFFRSFQNVLETHHPQRPIFADCHKWKENASGVLSRIHQQDYAEKNFKDPLGIAINQIFDIGIGYRFDHMTPLKPDELIVSTRRLQARAAKSAIRHAQVMQERTNKAIRQIADPNERIRMAVLLKMQNDVEMACIARRLYDLIPLKISEEFEIKDPKKAKRVISARHRDFW